MSLKIIHNDITEMKSDAIVNAANRQLRAGGGVCGAIFKKAGYKEMEKACKQYKAIQTGESVITPGFNLKAKYVIHTVGPIYKDGKHNEKKLLIKSYQSALELALKYHLSSISFPVISSGIYGYPKKEALEVAVDTIKAFLENHDMEVNIVVFDRSAVSISEELYQNIEHYIDTFFFEESRREMAYITLAKRCFFDEDNSLGYTEDDAIEYNEDHSLEDFINLQKESFSTYLLHLIDEKGYEDVEVYKRANIDRKLFSKIRSQKDYHPKKNTVFSFAIALRLDVDETVELLDHAGYSLSYSQKSDLIIRYFIENKQYDIFRINEALFCFDQPLLAT